MKTSPFPHRRPPIQRSFIERLEARIAPASLVLTPGNGPFTLELDPADSHLHITDGLGLEIFDQGSPIGDDLFVTGGGMLDEFFIVSSVAGNAAFTGTLSIDVAGAIRLQGAVSTGVDLALTSGRTISQSGNTNLSLGASSAHYTAALTITLDQSSLTTGSGDIVLNANLSGAATGDFVGISLLNASIASLTGNITLNGSGGTAAVAGDHGVQIETSSSVTSMGGNIDITGRGGGSGATTFHMGVIVARNSTVSTIGTGTITIDGVGGAAGDSNWGVALYESGTVSAEDGNVTIIGTSGGGSSSHGIILANFGLGGGVVTTTGAGTIALTGDDSAAGLNSSALNLTGAGSRIGGGSTLGAIVLAGDSMSIGVPVTASGVFPVVIHPRTNGALIDLGSADSAATLGLSDAELDLVSAGTVQIGDGNSGAIILSAAITHANNLSLVSGAGISGSGALTLAASKNLSVTADGAVNFGGAVTVSGLATLAAGAANNLTLTSAGNDLATVAIASGATVSLRDNGGFDLGASSISTALIVESAGAITQSAPLGGAASLTKLGSGTLTLSLANTFSGRTFVTAGALLLAHPNALQNSTVVNGPATDLRFASGVGAFTFGGLEGTGGLALNDVTQAPIDLRVGNNDADTVFSGVLSGPGQLVKIGGGTLTLKGFNVQTGGTTVDGGILQVASDRNLGAPDAPLSFTGGTLHVTKSVAILRPIVLLGGTATFEVNPGQKLTLKGVISGPGNLAIGDTGVVELANPANTNTGSTELDSNGAVIIQGVSISVPGAKSGVVVTPGPTPGSIQSIDLSGTTTPTSLIVKAPKNGTVQIEKIISNDSTAKINAIVLGAGVVLGDGVADTVPDLAIAGQVGRLQLSDINPHTIITLGKGLAYLDTYRNRPNLTMNNILGEGVIVDVTGDGVTPGGPGGGGLGKVTINSWGAPGLIKTTQSIASFRLKQGDCYADIQVDPNHLGALSVASMGAVAVPDGAWVGGGMQVEGVVAKFLTKGLATDTVISAGAFGPVNIKGNYDGTVVAAADSSVTKIVKGKTRIVATGAIASVSISGDFSGLIDGDGKVGNVSLSGTARFQGSLHGGSLGNISAAVFTGTPDGSEPYESITAVGSIGKITAKSGGLTDYLIAAGTDLSESTTAAGIASVIVKGRVAGTTIVAGVDPVDGIYGNGNDVARPAPPALAGKAKIGPLKFERTSVPTLFIADTASSSVANAFAAPIMTSVQFGNGPSVPSNPNYLRDFEVAHFIDSGGSSIIVQLI